MAEATMSTDTLDRIREDVHYSRTLVAMLYDTMCSDEEEEDVNAPDSKTQRSFALVVAIRNHLDSLGAIDALGLRPFTGQKDPQEAALR